MNSVYFCAGCNERFATAAENPICPQCGQAVSTWLNAPTMDFSEVEVRGVIAAKPSESADEFIGTRLAHYEVETVLGQGGMGRVYRARHISLERPCALKILNHELVLKNPLYIELFLSEARAAASLVHPNVVTIHNIGNDSGVHFIEMEYILGRSLASLVERQGRLDITEATRMMMQVAAALKLAHASQLIHRDIKPGNVLVTADGDAKLADFGLAKRVARRGDDGKSSNLSGTPYFMAPELFAGQPADPRSDVYAMGITYYMLLAGQLPFRGASLPEVVSLHEQAPVPELVGPDGEIVSGAVRTVIERCLKKAPEERYSNAAELYLDLAAAYGGLRSLESLLRAGLAETPTEIREDGDRFAVIVHLPRERTQTVYVDLTSEENVSDRNVRIYSVCGPADPGYYERALELNAILPHGSIAIDRINGQSHFVMTNAYPKATCDPEELRKSVLSIARHADRMDQFLTGGDSH